MAGFDSLPPPVRRAMAAAVVRHSPAVAYRALAHFQSIEGPSDDGGAYAAELLALALADQDEQDVRALPGLTGYPSAHIEAGATIQRP